jgi:N-acetylglucosaminyl-diphospho-decaprenol L-rhamnosyltransferase
MGTVEPPLGGGRVPNGEVGRVPLASGVGAVVVNHNAGSQLIGCVERLRAEGASEIVVVDNASTDGSVKALESSVSGVRILNIPENLGYGAGANMGLRELRTELVVVSNPDVSVHPGSLKVLESLLVADPLVAIVGPRVEEPDGRRYPSARRFPSAIDATGHALLGPFLPNNRYTRRYKMEELDATVASRVDWVSGAFFMARREALAELGGFDESYFMYVEDVDLCWRARQAGWEIAYAPDAVVTHLRGVSTARHPYRMLLAHHRSALLFASRRARGWQRMAVPAVALGLAVRLGFSWVRQALSDPRARGRSASGAD